MATASSMGNDGRVEGRLRVPALVPLFNRVAKRAASAGLMGPNVLLTVPGRSSGLPRSTPVALVKVGERRWIIGTFGAVNWVHNLRASGEATITAKGKPERIRAVELSPTEGAQFFREVLAPYVRRLAVGRLLLGVLGAADILTDPDGAARRRPVFELKPIAR
jgi:deazaflavin-dependent oxidoreductase (nitroreductase family)